VERDAHEKRLGTHDRNQHIYKDCLSMCTYHCAQLQLYNTAQD